MTFSADTKHRAYINVYVVNARGEKYCLFLPRAARSYIPWLARFVRFKDHPILHIKLPFVDASVTEAFQRAYNKAYVFFAGSLTYNLVHSAASFTRRERFKAHSKQRMSMLTPHWWTAYINQQCMHVMRGHSSRYSGESCARHLTALILKGLKSTFEDSIYLYTLGWTST